MALGKVKILNFWPYFETFRECCPDKAGFLGSIEITIWVNLFCISDSRSFFKTRSPNSRNCQISDLLTFFWTFLDNYSAKSDIIGLIDKTVCWKLTFVIVYAQFVLNSYGLQASELFETLTGF